MYAHNVESIDLLLEMGANLEFVAFGMTALTWHIFKGRIEVVRHLLKKGASLNNFIERRNTANFSVLKVLFEYKNINEFQTKNLLPQKTFVESYFIVEMMKQSNYKIDFEYLEELKYIKRKRCLTALFCFDMYDGNEEIYDYIRDNDVKVNMKTLPYMSNYKKQCMKMILMCIQRITESIG